MLIGTGTGTQSSFLRSGLVEFSDGDLSPARRDTAAGVASYAPPSGIEIVGTATQAMVDGVVATPDGVQAGDVLVAMVSAYQFAGSPLGSPPDGWTLQQQVTHGSGGDDNITVWLYTFVVTDPPPDTFTWSDTHFGGIGVLCVAYRNVDNVTPMNAVQGNDAFGTTQTGLSVPVTAGSLTLFLFMGDSNHLLTAPVGMTARIDGTTEHSTVMASFGAYGLYDLLNVADGDSGEIVSTTAAPDDWVVMTTTLNAA